MFSKTISRLFLTFSFLAILFSACSDPIFYEIRKEVELEDAEVSGSINSMTRFKNYIFVQNGKLYRKSASSTSAHGWTEITRPPTSADYVYVNKVAADSNYLYVQVTKIDEDEMEGTTVSSGCEIWCSASGDGTDWQLCTPYGSGTYYSSRAILFGNNDATAANRKAYVSILGNVNKLYQLNGTEASVSSSGSYESRSCAGSGPEFHTGWASVASADGTKIYYSDGSSVRGAASFSVGYTIYSLAVTSDRLLVGCRDGLRIYSLDGATDYTSSFANTESTLSEDYEVRSVLVADPSKPLSETVVYASSDYTDSDQSYTNVGLWSYIPSRGSWNRE